MTQDRYGGRVAVERRLRTGSVAVAGLLAAFWTVIGLGSLGVEAVPVRAALGLVLLFFVPGALLARLAGVGTGSPGRFVLFAVGLSVATVAAVDLGVAVVGPLVGITQPLSVLPLVAALSVVIVVLAGLDHRRRTGDGRPRTAVDLTGPLPVRLLVFSLPLFAVLAAFLMNRFESNAGMTAFVLIAGAVVLVATTRYVPPNLYAPTVLSVALATVLHRNLVSDHVVGADVQHAYFVSRLVAETGQWGPEIGGSTVSLLTVTTVPATVALLTGLSLAVVFKVVYAALFALVPVGVFYATRDVFDRKVAFLAALFFLFYHGSFYFTPGKQLISELFVVLLLLLLVRGALAERGARLAAMVLAFGLATSHYGTAYVFGIAALAASIGLLLTDRFVGDIDHDLPLSSPLAFLVGTTAWYVYSSSELIGRLAAIVPSLLGQLGDLLSGATVGTGASYVGGQESLLGYVAVVLYVLLTGLVGLGLAWKLFDTLRGVRRGEVRRDVEFVALAVPLFVFLGSSYVAIINLWADRAYQMTLPVLAAFAPLGLSVASGSVGKRLGREWTGWRMLAALLVLLFAFNSGLAFALAGTPEDYTFDSNANDYAFDRAERSAGAWLKGHVPVERAAENEAGTGGETVRIYTDTYSSQLLRSIIPEEYYNVEIVQIKDAWHPQFDSSRIESGYVLVRKRAVVSANGGSPVGVSQLSQANVSRLERTGDVVFTNGAVEIIRVGNGTAN